ncbi:MAG TPA: outer membrane lipoprotein chaperone LolA [Ideonella sp.]|nr:outer membrane lipoprotein chaperone LolA [Ideonella sp.]
MKRLALAVALAAAALAARADAVDTLRAFVRDARSGRADFAQTVTSPDGKRTKTSSGRFEFERPNRFRFEYTKPFEELIVGDGRKVWIYDADLNQVSSRKVDQAIGATPAALLAGASLERDFELQPLPDADGMSWVQATPRHMEGSTVQGLKVGFRGNELAAIEITDSFGQRSRIAFGNLATNVALPARDFEFKPPAGADVIEQ